MSTPLDYLSDDALDSSQSPMPPTTKVSAHAHGSPSASHGRFASSADSETSAVSGSAKTDKKKDQQSMDISPASSQAAMPVEIQQHLGNLLKASYNDVLTAPIPDRFLKLLQELEDKDLQAGPGKNSK